MAKANHTNRTSECLGGLVRFGEGKGCPAFGGLIKGVRLNDERKSEKWNGKEQNRKEKK